MRNTNSNEVPSDVHVHHCRWNPRTMFIHFQRSLSFWSN